MHYWKLTIAYDGTAFHGWQVQPGLRTVQGILAETLLRLTGEDLLPQGSGRTDAGVHALAQVVSFSLDAPIPPANLRLALNRTLPASIRVLTAEELPEPFHARHHARSKTYEYRLFPRKPPRTGPITPAERICPPFLAPYVWDCSWRVDLDLLQQAAQHVLGEHDFTSFAAHDPDRATRIADTTNPAHNIRTIFASDWRRQDDLYLYTVTGNGFLHHMVRNLVGTFVDAASGRIAPSDIPAILAARTRRAAGPTAPASGLFLVNVEY